MKGVISTNSIVIFSVIMLLLVLVMFGYRLGIFGDISFSACWNDVKNVISEIAYTLEGPRVSIVGKDYNMTVEQGTACSEKILFINHDDLVKNANDYRIFLDICSLSEGGSYILGYPELPEAMGSWWTSPFARFKEELKRKVAGMQISPACYGIEKPFSSKVNMKELSADKAYCLQFPEKKGTVEEYDFKIEVGTCEELSQK